MATIRDVAQRAGVSTMTVSRVLNNSGYVSVDARTRVEAAVADLGYVPNTLGLSLRFKRTKTLALVVTDIANPFFTGMVRGVEDVASQQGFSTILCNTDESEAKQADYLTILLQKRVDGILLVPARSAAAPVRWLQQRNVPVVIIDRQAPGARVDCVRGQSEEGGHDLAAFLYDLGHRDVAVLTGPAYVSTAAERVAGFERAWRERGLVPRPGSVMYGRVHGSERLRDDAATADVGVAAHRAAHCQQLHRDRRRTGRCATPTSPCPKICPSSRSITCPTT